tara:strand:- start:3002 stop:4714 length:1713 start_codon:yes stop_codon:yes gene_type:complete
MEKVLIKHKFEFFSLDTYKPYNAWPRVDRRRHSDVRTLNGYGDTQLFNMSSRWEQPEGYQFTLEKSEKSVSEEEWKEKSFDILCDARVKRVTFILSKNEKKNQIKLSLFYFQKGKKTGQRYYWKHSQNYHLSFNTKINDVFLIRQRKMGSKWSTNLTRNDFHNIGRSSHFGIEDILEFLGTRHGSIQMAYTETLLGLFEQLTNTEVPIKEGFTHVKTYYPGNVLKDIVLPWFISKKNLKLPDYYERLLISHYPGIKLLRKNDMNLGKTILKKRGVYSKYANKLINTEPKFNLFSYKSFLDVFGKHNIKKLNKDLFNQDGYGTQGMDDYYAVLDKRELKNLIKLVNLTPEGRLDINTINDHLRLKVKLKEREINVRLKTDNLKDFEEEHLEWSNKLSKAQRIIETKYEYPEQFTKQIETTFTSPWNKEYTPVILKDDLEYKEEGNYQNHCVGSYVDTYHSDIISVRKEDGERATLEYHIKPRSKEVILKQAQLRFNQPPTEEWEEVIEFITNIIIDLVNEKLYDNPKITTRHLYNGFTKEIDYDEVKDNDLLFEPYPPMNYNPQTEEALPF